MLPRSRHDARPAPPRGPRRDRPLSQRRDPDHRHHRRSSADRGCDRPPGRHRWPGPRRRQRGAARPPSRARNRTDRVRRPRGDLRARLAGRQAAHRRGVACTGSRGSDDRRRRQRRPRPAPRRHRRRDGPGRNRRRPRSGHHGAHRRQLRLDRRRRRGGPRRLRQRPQVHRSTSSPTPHPRSSRSSSSRSPAVPCHCR